MIVPGTECEHNQKVLKQRWYRGKLVCAWAQLNPFRPLGMKGFFILRMGIVPCLSPDKVSSILLSSQMVGLLPDIVAI